MTRYLVVLCLFFALFHQTSQAEETYFDTNVENSAVINLSGAPNGVVHGCVNVISGDFLDYECDFVSGGSDPIVFERNYTSSDHRLGQLGYGWFHNQGGLLTLTGGNHENYSELLLQGHPLHFYSWPEKPGERAPLKNKIDVLQFYHGYTNCSTGKISGKLDQRNYKLEYVKDHGGANVKCPTGDNLAFHPKDKKKEVFHLLASGRGNGNFNMFYYTDDCATGIATYNSGSQYLSGIAIDVLPEHSKSLKDPCLKLRSDDGREVLYQFKQVDGKKGHLIEKHRLVLNKVERTDFPSITYDYTEPTEDSLERIERKIYPENRFTNVNYYSKKGVYLKGSSKFVISSRKHYCFNKVYRLSEPVGHDARPIPIFTFLYKE